MTRPADIPEDVLALACKAHGYADDQAGTWAQQMIHQTARAILAERERCADRAREHAGILRQNFDHSCARAVEGVADAILESA